MRVLAEISYERVDEIGVGEGMNSRVYLADEPQLGGQVAVKEIDKTQFGNVPAEFFREAKTMFRTTHVNVVPIQYACETATSISLAMPYYPNGSLAKRIADRPLQLSETLRVAQGVLAGLAQIHLAGFVHFDLKPSNVLFSNVDAPMVADFGQARAISAAGVVTAPRLYYTAFPPEVVKTGVGTILSDIYQVGLLLYRALNGNQFFEDQIPVNGDALERAIASGKFPDRRRFMPHVPRRLRTVVRKALNVDPTARFESATDIADILGRVPLYHDWLTQPLPNGGFRWVSSRPGYADLVVELISRAEAWDVQTFTQSAGQAQRGKGKKENWRTALTLKEAHLHLKHAFARLAR
jgi:serine/threonine protein kinase